MSESTCSAEGCDQPAHRIGLCSAHYQRKRRAEAGTCTADGCIKRIHATGLCHQHYDLRRADGATCKVDGCEKPPRGVGYCGTHYYRYNRHGDAGTAELRRKPPRPCKVDGCNNPAVGRDDLCRSHLDRLREYGSIEGRLCACGVRTTKGSDLCPEHYVAEMKRRIGLGERPVLPGVRRSTGKGNRTGGGYIGFRVLNVVILEHRAVMERLLGRDLYPFENVHHKNGRRDDNDPSNLELWVETQPSGQRPKDLVAWVVEYYPDLVRAALESGTQTS